MLDLAPNPCLSCPYRLDHPSGVWSLEEYEKLRGYDDDIALGPAGVALSVFLCHQTNATGRETACKGWTTVHSESIAVRIAIASGSLDPEQVYAETSVACYESGNAAADAGEEDIEWPGADAEEMTKKLVKSRAGRIDADA
jgi:hypothetical protein